MWPIEEIPNLDLLYYRVHDGFFSKKGLLSPGVFQERGEGDSRGMSTDWSKYSTPETALGKKAPEKNSVVGFVTEDLRNLQLRVIHAPEDDNRAHTNVKDLEGENYLEIRLKLLTLLTWQIKSQHALSF